MTVTEKSEISFTSGVCVCVCVCVCVMWIMSQHMYDLCCFVLIYVLLCGEILKKTAHEDKNDKCQVCMVIAAKQNRNARPTYLFDHHNQTPGFIMIDDYQKTQIILDFLPIFLRKFRAAL